jgi:hypothetical protein
MSENIIRAVIVTLYDIGSSAKPIGSKGFARLPNNKGNVHGVLEENDHFRIQP